MKSTMKILLSCVAFLSADAKGMFGGSSASTKTDTSASKRNAKLKKSVINTLEIEDTSEIVLSKIVDLLKVGVVLLNEMKNSDDYVRADFRDNADDFMQTLVNLDAQFKDEIRENAEMEQAVAMRKQGEAAFARESSESDGK